MPIESHGADREPSRLAAAANAQERFKSFAVSLAVERAASRGRLAVRLRPPDSPQRQRLRCDCLSGANQLLSWRHANQRWQLSADSHYHGGFLPNPRMARRAAERAITAGR